MNQICFLDMKKHQEWEKNNWPINRNRSYDQQSDVIFKTKIRMVYNKIRKVIIFVSLWISATDLSVQLL